MLSAIVKDHQTKQAVRREQQGILLIIIEYILNIFYKTLF